jgi:Lar family restriction alleviation protein
MSNNLRCGWVDAEREGDCSFCGSKRELKVLRVSGKKEGVSEPVNSPRQNELLPCPFCGDTNVTVQEYDTKDAWWTVCDNIYCGTEGPAKKTREATVAAWNKRAARSVSDGCSSSGSEFPKPTEVRFCYSCLKELIAKQRWGAGKKVL